MVRLHIPLEVWQQIYAYARAALPNEVTGIGLIEITDMEVLKVKKIFLPRQQTCPGFCDFVDGELNRILFEVMQEDPQLAKMLCFRWHSHAEGAVFWSMRDEQDIRTWKGTWVANLVVNTRGDYLARLDVFDPLRLENLPLEVAIDCPPNPEIDEVCGQEIAAKLTVIQQITKMYPSDKGGDKFGLFGSKPDF